MTEKVQYIEIDLRRCSEVYGVAPCTASLGTTGEKKCFNSYATCQDTSNFDEITTTIRFSSVSQDLPVGIVAVPNITGINFTPATVELGKSLGTRSKLSISFKDHTSPDTEAGGDPYLISRSYNPYTQGTYWGKFKARNALIRGLTLRWIQGDNNQDIAGMETRTLIVDEFTGPDSNGNVTIIAKDALKLVDGPRAQAPALSGGRLSAALTDSATSLTLIPSGIGATYPASGLVAIGGEEIVSFTRSSDVLTIVRAQNNTEAKAHDDGSRVQLCKVITSQDPADIINDLMVNYSQIPSSYIPLTTWQEETGTYINRLYSSVIAEPTPVNKLINEILEQTATALWWDDQTGLIRLRVLRNVPITAFEYNDDLIMKGSVSIKDQPSKRVSQVWTYFGQINPLEGLEEVKNYRSTLLTINTDSEVKYGSAQVKTIFSRWITTGSRSAASDLNDLILARYSEPPRLLGFRLMRDANLTQPALVGGYQFNNWSIQNDEGLTQTIDIQTTRIQTTAAYFEVTAEEALYSASVAPADPNNLTITLDSSINNIDLYALASAQTAITASTTATFVIEEGVVIGSVSSGSYSVVTGAWPSGATINLINYGKILGKGGEGGDIVGAGTGGSGGDAISVTYDIDITNENLIGGGGGGGGVGGGHPNIVFGKFQAGGAGGGGQGQSGGSGGSGSYPAGSDGNDGASGSILSNGSGGASIVSGSKYTGAGGNGGTLGVAGASGTNGNGGFTGVAGGAAGDAVVQSGATATITNNGTISGAIV